MAACMVIVDWDVGAGQLGTIPALLVIVLQAGAGRVRMFVLTVMIKAYYYDSNNYE
jgi:hypothetical protein